MFKVLTGLKIKWLADCFSQFDCLKLVYAFINFFPGICEDIPSLSPTDPQPAPTNG